LIFNKNFAINFYSWEIRGKKEAAGLIAALLVGLSVLKER